MVRFVNGIGRWPAPARAEWELETMARYAGKSVTGDVEFYIAKENEHRMRHYLLHWQFQLGGSSVWRNVYAVACHANAIGFASI